MRAPYAEVHDTTRFDARVARIAAKQHGVFTRVQALRAGASPSAISWRLRTGRWTRIHHCVYRLAGAPVTWRQQAIAAHYFCGRGSALSHKAAAKIQSFPRYLRAHVEVTVRRNRNRSAFPGIKIHWIAEPIPPEDVTTIDGIPVTKPARTLLDLATVESEEVIGRCLDDCLRRKLVSLAFLDEWLRDPRRARHRGAPMLRRLVDSRAATGVTGSALEAQVLALLREEGLPMPMLQYVIESEGRFLARVDFAYPEQRVAIEVDGFMFHDTRDGFDRERARGNELEALGWRVLRITSAHLEHHREDVALWIRRALEIGS